MNPLTACGLLVGLLNLLVCMPTAFSTTATTENETVPAECSRPMCCGSPGQPGIPGIPGTPGGFGPAGAPGSKGDKGEFIRGETGARGQKGEPGDVGFKGNKGSEGSPGKQGPLGRSGQQGAKGNNGSKGEKGELGLAAPQPRKSAFTAVRTSKFETANSIITFTTMEINIGEDFDKTNGKFTCNVSGVYYFMFSFLTLGSLSNTYVTMRLNDRMITSAHRRESPGYDQLSSGATVQLNVGDQVWLKNEGSRSLYGDSTHHPITFTGFLIYDMN